MTSTDRMTPGDVERAVRRDLRKAGLSTRAPTGLAAAALALAQLMDGECRGVCKECDEEMSIRVDASARDMAAVARELRATMEILGRRGDSDTGAAFVAGLLSPVDDPEDGPADPRRRARAVRGGARNTADAVAAARRGRRPRTGP
jgi:hypothetical protein